MSKKLHRSSGFSLIEILIVLVVLGIIASIAIGQLLSARDKARQGATISDMRNIATAIEAYMVDNTQPPTNGDFSTVALQLRSYYNEHVPVEDHWGNQYDYASELSGAYSLTSFGKDGIDGLELTPTTQREFERDIVVANGEFPGLP